MKHSRLHIEDPENLADLCATYYIIMDANIEAVAVLPTKRRQTEINWHLCIICQSGKQSDLSQGSQQGIDKMREAYEIRIAHNDSSFAEGTNTIGIGINETGEKKPKLYSSCYTSYTSKANINAMINRSKKN